MKKWIIIVTIILQCAGCALLRQSAIDISTENIKNAEAIREVSKNCISVWPVQSGFLKGTLGYRINELPNESIEAIEELDRLAALPERTDYELGYFLGLKVRLLSSAVKVAIDKYVPGFLPHVF